MSETDRYKLVLKWAKLLGWPTLKRYEHRIDESAPEDLRGLIIRWYEWECRKTGIVFQVNRMPVWHAGVYAIRYRICTGWHVFRLRSDPSSLRREAERVGDFLRADWFLSAEGRHLFRKQHPECAGITWKRIQTEGLPYSR